MSLLSGILQKTHFEQWSGEALASYNPATGKELGRVRLAEEEDYDDVLWDAVKTFERWRMEPAPKRGEIVREIGEELRAAKDELGLLVTLEAGKILAEGRGEVQEMIDIATFAAGLSRQLYGLSMHSERPGHRMYEQWHPLGVVGVISAFNFPVAVWSWNAFLAMVCGDVVVWKPSLKTPLTAIAVQKIADRVLERHNWKGVLNLVIGKDDVVGERLIGDPRVPLISATGSTRMGRHVAQVVAKRLGRTLLELGGNNGLIVMDDADPDLVVRAVLFGAVGTAGQRCTTLRRLFLQKNVAPKITARLIAAYEQVRIGDPSDPNTLMGPLIDADAVAIMMRALDDVREQGGELLSGGERLNTGDCYVAPALVRSHERMPIVKEEIFAPILHLIEFERIGEAIQWHNNVPQRAGQRLRHRQCEQRHQRRGDRWGVRRREGNRRRTRIRQRCVEGLHAAADGDGELVRRAAAGAGYRVRGFVRLLR
jgi:aldehyde dehydrogenase (NAD+)